MILGIDLETTGLDTATVDVIEVGAVLWDEVKRVPITMYNALIANRTVPEEITKITGITQEQIDVFGLDLGLVSEDLVVLLKQAKWIVAHNGKGFDRLIWERVFNALAKKPWIDTSVDVPYPAQIQTRKLTHLAAEHGFVNPFPHRAATDVLTMLTVLSRYDFATVEKYAAAPDVEVVARVSFDEKEKAKARGYRWNAEFRRWSKIVKDFQLEAEKAEAGFQVTIL